VPLRCQKDGERLGAEDEGDRVKLERIRDAVDLPSARPAGSADDEDGDEMVERRVLDVTRRGVLAALSASSIAGFVKIYGDNELNVLDSAWRAVFPRKAARIRGPLQPALAAALSGAIRAAALEDLRLLSPAALAAAEVEQAARAASFFPKLSPADLAAVAALPPAPAGGAPLAPLLESEAGANLALYATLHSLEPALPSPRSRKDMAARVGRRVADALLPPPPPAAPGGAPSARGPAGREAFLGALRALLDAYAAGGFAVASIGEKAPPHPAPRPQHSPDAGS